MYQINIGDYLLVLTNSDKALQNQNKAIVVEYDRQPNSIISLIEKAENDDWERPQLVLYSQDLNQLWEDFCQGLKIHKAGGGVVFNPTNEILAIFRMGFWDLPKGKQDPGETIEQTAIREVQEETGIQDVTLGEAIVDTFHIYKSRKGKRILKWAAWFKMTTNEMDLTPQAEEDIELAVWLTKADFLAKQPIYDNILRVLNKV